MRKGVIPKFLQKRELAEPSVFNQTIEGDKPLTDNDLIKRLWIDVAARTAGSDNCTSIGSAGKFANQAVEDFKTRFGL
jgi:hypothetical protein